MSDPRNFLKNKSETPTRWRANGMQRWAWTPTRRWRSSPRSRSACTAGRATMWAASRHRSGPLGGGLAATGNYPGKARTAEELRQRPRQGVQPDPRQAPPEPARHLRRDGRGEGGTRRSCGPSISPAGSTGPRSKGHGLDFNPTLFSHPKADSGFTLASYDAGIRTFWIDHCIACREIGESFGRELGTPCVTNIWIPDGCKDTPADRKTPARCASRTSLDEILAETIDPTLQPGRGRGQAVRPRLRELHRRLARVLPGLRRGQQDAARAGQRPLPPHRDHRRQALRRADVTWTRCCCTSAAGCAGTATTW